MKPYRLAIIGAGSWGTALALHLARKGIAICLWDRNEDLMRNLVKERRNTRYLPDFAFPESLFIESDFEIAIKKAQDVLIVVPSYAFESVLNQLLSVMSSDMRILWATKGIEPKNDLLLHTLVEQVFTKSMPFAVLSGPSFAAEVAAGLPTAITVAGNNDDLQKEMVDLFGTETFRLYPTPDYIGAELGGCVKNILAIAVGMSDGLGYGTNIRAVLITHGLEEMISLGVAMGASHETFLGLAGLGDLVLTCTDSLSRNRRFGLALGEGYSAEKAEENIGQSIEGKNNVRQIRELAQKHHVTMPIVEAVFEILTGQKQPKEGLIALLQ